MSKTEKDQDKPGMGDLFKKGTTAIEYLKDPNGSNIENTNSLFHIIAFSLCFSIIICLMISVFIFYNFLNEETWASLGSALSSYIWYEYFYLFFACFVVGCIIGLFKTHGFAGRYSYDHSLLTGLKWGFALSFIIMVFCALVRIAT